MLGILKVSWKRDWHEDRTPVSSPVRREVQQWRNDQWHEVPAGTGGTGGAAEGGDWGFRG